MTTIEHSGYTFRSLGRTESGIPIWPIREYLVRRKHSQTVAERIERLNPNGKPEGESPRGWRPSQSGPSFDTIKIRDAISMLGSEKYRTLPKSAFIRLGGRRRRVAAVVVINEGINA